MPGALHQIWGWLRRFRWPAELWRLFSPPPDLRTQRRPRGARRAIGGKRRARKVWAPPFPSTSSRLGAQSHRLMPPLFPSWSFPHGSQVVVSGSSSEESDEEIEEEEEFLFSNHSERAVYQEYLQSISRNCGEEDLPDGATSVSLFKHQRMALDWMIFWENNSHCAGGILADEQGLGKTIVVIALILKEIDQQSKITPADCDSSQSTLSSRAKRAGGTLSVSPSSILMQWDEEIRRVAKGFGLSVFVYHGHSRIVDSEELAKHDVVLTSYGMVKQQFGSRKNGIGKKPSDTDDLNSGPIAWVKWSRIVLDEAHVIRNNTSQVARACWKLEAERRWCITGTPIQNRIDDLYSYLRFLRYEPYSKYSSFCSLLKRHNSTDASLGRNKIEIFLGIILLRRTKETFINGEPIIKLLPRRFRREK